MPNEDRASDNGANRKNGWNRDGNAVRPSAVPSDPKHPYGFGFGPDGWNVVAYDTNATLDFPFERMPGDKTHLDVKRDPYYDTEEWLSYNNGKRLEYLAKERRKRMDKVMFDYVKGYPEHRGMHYDEYTQK